MSKTMQCRSLVFLAGIKSGSIAKKKIKIQNPKRDLSHFYAMIASFIAHMTHQKLFY